MKRILALLFFAAFSLQPVNANPITNNDVKGDWSGILDAGAIQLTLILHIDRNKEGALAAKFDVVEQGGIGIPVDVITVDGQSLKFEINGMKASYAGTINKDINEVTGTFTQGQSFPLTFKRGLIQVQAPKRPQTPKPPFPYAIEEVSYKSKAAGVTLLGTLTMPKSKSKVPAVLLITGSGPQDRDETIMGHKPFWVLADYLSRRGIAVLRVDDRGVGKSTGEFAAATSEDFATDVLAGVEYLKARKEINAAKIGLIGHSEGGIVAPMVAAKSKDVAFIVMLAAPGLSGEKTLYAQGELILRANGASEEIIALNRKCQGWMFTVLKEEKDPAVGEKRLRQSSAKCFSQLAPEARKTFHAALDQQIKFVNSAWFRHFLTFEPATVLQQVTVPVLALNGEQDLQVPPKQNLLAINIAVRQGGNKDITTMTLPGINHLFQKSKTGAVSEYMRNEETISGTVLEIIAEWILSKSS